MLIAVGLAALVTSFALLALGVDPVPGYFYLFAWYPTLVLLDALAHRADGRPLALANRRAILSLWLWSIPVWLLFEAANFRLDNWYYVFVPPNQYLRWGGFLLAFATVLPALFLAERLLDSMGFGRAWRTRQFSITPAGLYAIFALGVIMLALSLWWPRAFFPYIWGALWLMCEPYVYRRRPDLSLFADLERGEWGRTGRLLVGGAFIGLLWETFNFWARAKWIYTVPGLENLKLYEMPLLGFIGFPFFALEAWAIYHALCAAGVAIPLAERSLPRPRRVVVAAATAAVLSFLVLRCIDERTVSSFAPPRSLMTRAASESPDGATQVARLAMLRGIGNEHARRLEQLGIRDVCTLAAINADMVWNTLHRRDSSAVRPSRAEVRVWQKAAARECGG